jgi:helix-turn-helix protein
MDSDILTAIWLDCKDLSDPERNLLQALAHHCHHKTYTCWPSVGRLSKMIRRTERHTRRLLRSLEEKEYISVKVQRGRNHTNLVTINRTRICPLFGKTGHSYDPSKPDIQVSAELLMEKEENKEENPEGLLGWLGLTPGSEVWIASMNGHLK